MRIIKHFSVTGYVYPLYNLAISTNLLNKPLKDENFHFIYFFVPRNALHGFIFFPEGMLSIDVI
jgi:hypothetical protein